MRFALSSSTSSLLTFAPVFRLGHPRRHCRINARPDCALQWKARSRPLRKRARRSLAKTSPDSFEMEDAP